MIKTEKIKIIEKSKCEIPLFMHHILTNKMNEIPESEFFRYNKVIQTNIPYMWSEKSISKNLKY